MLHSVTSRKLNINLGVNIKHLGDETTHAEIPITFQVKMFGKVKFDCH